jgi:hypothetical protein
MYTLSLVQVVVDVMGPVTEIKAAEATELKRAAAPIVRRERFMVIRFWFRHGREAPVKGWRGRS